MNKNSPLSLASLIPAMVMTPQKTIIKIVGRFPVLTALLGSIGMVSQSLDSQEISTLATTGGSLWFVIFALLMSLCSGFLLWYGFSWCLSMGAQWLKGTAGFRKIKYAVAWSSLPLILSFLLMLILLYPVILPVLSWTQEMPPIAAWRNLSYTLYLIAELALVVWSFVLLVSSVSALNKFSIGCALGSLFLAALVVAIPLFFFNLLGSFFIH